MADYIERVSFVGWFSRTKFQKIWVMFLAIINPSNQNNNDNEQITNCLTKEEIFGNKCYTMSLFDHLFSPHGLDLTSFLQILIEFYVRWLTANPNSLCLQLTSKSCILLEQTTKESNELYQRLIERYLKYLTKTNAYVLCIRLNGFILPNVFYLIENNYTNSYEILSLLFKHDTLDINDNLTQQIISIGLERLLLLSQYRKNHILCS
ncbi:unnamed protein product [Rotaria sp. Silwood2]|nr:unnamed protein product [Rotaria sp. Silwood2]